MNLNVSNLWSVEIGGEQFWITQTQLNSWIISALMIALAIFARIKIGKFEETPGKVQNAVEALIEIFDSFVRSTAGDKLTYLGNWFFAVFTFILFSNLSGMFGMRPPTADWTTTFAFALATFTLIQVMGLKYRGMGYIKTFFEPHPVFLPLNLVGELARPISLSFRLFGNVLAGMILMTLLYSLAPVFVRFFIPMPLHAFFDVFSGGLQTYIFCVLSITFVGAAAAEEP